MSRFKVRIWLIGSLVLITLGEHAAAAVETIPVSAIPPPPGELVLSFPNSSVPNPDNTRLRFSGSVRSNPGSPLTTVTLRYNWTLASGDLAYSNPVTYVLDPGMNTFVDSIRSAEGCPSLVSVDFRTESPVGATVSGSFDHACTTVPEPGIFALFELAASCVLLLERRRRVRCLPSNGAQPLHPQ